MNFSNRLSPITLIFCLLLVFGCSDALQDNNYNRYNTVKDSCSLAPDAIGVEDYITTPSGMDGIKYVWTEVEGASYEFQLIVNSEITPMLSSQVGTATSYTIESLFEIDDVITARVRTLCSKGAASEWTEISSVNKNGGATVDDIPSAVDWDYVCNTSPCEYLRFIDNEVENCEGDPVTLGIGYGGKNFYRKSDVCPCLFETTLCEGLGNITECLESPYLKRNYTTCN